MIRAKEGRTAGHGALLQWDGRVGAPIPEVRVAETLSRVFYTSEGHLEAARERRQVVSPFHFPLCVLSSRSDGSHLPQYSAHIPRVMLSAVRVAALRVRLYISSAMHPTSVQPDGRVERGDLNPGEVALYAGLEG